MANQKNELKKISTLQDIENVIQKWIDDKADRLDIAVADKSQSTQDLQRVADYHSEGTSNIKKVNGKEASKEPFGPIHSTLSEITTHTEAKVSEVTFDKLTESLKLHTGATLGSEFAKLSASIDVGEVHEQGTTDTHSRMNQKTEKHKFQEGAPYQQFCHKQPMREDFTLKNVQVSGKVTIKFNEKVWPYNPKSHQFDYSVGNVLQKTTQTVSVQDIFDDVVNHQKRIDPDTCSIRGDKVVFPSLKGSVKFMHVSYTWELVGPHTNENDKHKDTKKTKQSKTPSSTHSSSSDAKPDEHEVLSSPAKIHQTLTLTIDTDDRARGLNAELSENFMKLTPEERAAFREKIFTAGEKAKLGETAANAVLAAAQKHIEARPDPNDYKDRNVEIKEKTSFSDFEFKF